MEEAISFDIKTTERITTLERPYFEYFLQIAGEYYGVEDEEVSKSMKNFILGWMETNREIVGPQSFDELWSKFKTKV